MAAVATGAARNLMNVMNIREAIYDALFNLILLEQHKGTEATNADERNRLMFTIVQNLGLVVGAPGAPSLPGNLSFEEILNIFTKWALSNLHQYPVQYLIDEWLTLLDILAPEAESSLDLSPLEALIFEKLDIIFDELSSYLGTVEYEEPQSIRVMPTTPQEMKVPRAIKEVKKLPKVPIGTIDFYDPKKKPYGVFSNFYPSPFVVDGTTYPTSEHFYQIQKFNDPWYRNLILSQKTAGKVKFLSDQKRSGRWKWQRDLVPFVDESVRRGVTIRPDWNEIKRDVMRQAVYEKFRQNPALKKILLSTGDAIIREASPRDSYWGIGKDQQGENWLGKILMEVRNRLR